MPRATVSRNNERFELKSCPEGFVVIRRMTYGEKLNRQDDMMNMRSSTDDKMMQIQLMNKKVALQDFSNLVVEHNLTDDDDRLLNFKNAQDVLQLDPRVGDEIGQLMDQLNSFEELPEVKN